MKGFGFVQFSVSKREKIEEKFIDWSIHGAELN